MLVLNQHVKCKKRDILQAYFAMYPKTLTPYVQAMTTLEEFLLGQNNLLHFNSNKWSNTRSSMIIIKWVRQAMHNLICLSTNES